MRQLVAALILAIGLAAVAPASAQSPVPIPDLPVPGPDLSPTPPLRRSQPPGSCTVVGTDGPDRLIGTAGPDVICGEGGDDVLEGFEGDDVLDGGDGVDTATWETSLCCVFADLNTFTASGFLGSDQLIGIENLAGSQGADVLRGDAAPNLLTGNGSTDLLYGGDGDDWLVGGAGDDWLAGETGANVLDGGFGANICADGLGTLCDGPDPSDPADVRGPLDVSLIDASSSGGTVSFRIAVRERIRSSRLWDEGYVVVSFDTRGGDEMDVHALAGWTERKPFGVLVREGSRAPTGRLRASRSGRAVVAVDVPTGSLGLDPGRLYYRWAAQTIFTGPGCRPCVDGVPEGGAYPQPLI